MPTTPSSPATEVDSTPFLDDFIVSPLQFATAQIQRGSLLFSYKSKQYNLENEANRCLKACGPKAFETLRKRAIQSREVLARAHLLAKSSTTTTSGPTNHQSKEDKLISQYRQLFQLLSSADLDLLERNVTNSLMKEFIQHAKDVFGKVAESEDWRKTGELLPWDMALLESIVKFSSLQSFCKLLAMEKAFRVFASLCAARTGHDLAAIPVAAAVIVITQKCFYTLVMHDKIMSNEKVATVFEGSGLLGQLFRLMTLPDLDPSMYDFFSCFCHFLMACAPGMVRKKLGSDKPTGELISAIRSGKNGAIVRTEENLAVLRELEKLEKLVEGSDRYRGNYSYCGCCRRCNLREADMPEGSQMLQCGQCKSANYCGRECQRADWARHKTECLPNAEAESQSAQKDRNSLVMNFLFENYMRVFASINDLLQREWDKGNRELTKADVVVVLDFFMEAPALQGKFTVSLVKDHLYGSRPATPDWFDDLEDWGGDQGLRGWHGNLKHHWQTMTPNHLLVAYRSNNGSAYASKLSDKAPHIFSNEALDCVGRGDIRGLCRAIGQHQAMDFLAHMIMKSGGSGPLGAPTPAEQRMIDESLNDLA